MKWFEQLSRKTRVFESTAFRPYDPFIFLWKLQNDMRAFNADWVTRMEKLLHRVIMRPKQNYLQHLLINFVFCLYWRVHAALSMVNLTSRRHALLTFFTQAVSDDPIKPLKFLTTLKWYKIKAIKFPLCLFLCLFSRCIHVQRVKTILEIHLLIGRCVNHQNKPLTVLLKTLFSFCFWLSWKKNRYISCN